MDRIVNMMVETYIRVMGLEKWNSLSAEEQIDTITAMVRELVERGRVDVGNIG